MPRVPGCDAVYEVADQWRERCLVGEGSLLWPNLDEPTWTVENLAASKQIMDELVRLRTTSGGHMEDRLAAEPDTIKRTIADATAVWNICPSSVEVSNRKSFVGWLAGQASGTPRLGDINAAIEANIGAKEASWFLPGYQLQRGAHLRYILELGRRIKIEKIDPSDEPAMHSLAQQINLELPRSASAKNMILHLLFPENIEPVFNNWARDKIVNAPAFRQYRGDLEDWDDILAAIRAGYSQEIGSDDFDFYDEQTRTVWVPQNQQPTTEPPLSEPNSEDRNGSEVNATSISLLTEVESTTHLSGDQLHEIETLLRSKKQIILEGPPGSGKTYVARLFARYLAGLPLEGEPDEHVEIVQFHQSYGYEDFVAGIRPVTGANGQLTYETRPGIFLEMCRRAAARPDDTFVLIIDEINRGNLSRIFGELLYGLEYRDQPVRMQYPVEVDGEPVEHLTIPDNLLLIGTMNSTDRSLAMIDYALRRRFYFWRLLPVSGDRTPVLKRWLDRQDALAVNQRGAIFAAFIELNESIEQLLGPDFQIGHSYFMLPAAELGDPGAWRRMWQYAIEPLLREYLHTRRDADVMIRDLQEQFLGRLTSDMFAAGVEETETAS